MNLMKKVKNKFEIKDLKTSILIWCLGCAVSSVPIIASFFYVIAVKHPEYIGINFKTFVFLNSDLMYVCVTAVTAVIADVIVCIRKNQDSNLPVFLLVCHVLMIVFGIFGYTLYKFTGGDYSFMLPVNIGYLIFIAVMCLLTQLYRYRK